MKKTRKKRTEKKTKKSTKVLSAKQTAEVTGGTGTLAYVYSPPATSTNIFLGSTDLASTGKIGGGPVGPGGTGG